MVWISWVLALIAFGDVGYLAMRDRTLEWSKSKGFEIFVTPGYESPTVPVWQITWKSTSLP